VAEAAAEKKRNLFFMYYVQQAKKGLRTHIFQMMLDVSSINDISTHKIFHIQDEMCYFFGSFVYSPSIRLNSFHLINHLLNIIPFASFVMNGLCKAPLLPIADHDYNRYRLSNA
jgi:hypothetical protein